MNNTAIDTPVLFLVFNRPEKTQRVFDVIREVQPLKLYIAADGPRINITSDNENCLKVRDIVSQIDWTCDAKFLFHEQNLGCSLAGKTAWDWLFGQEEEVIFIEDDGLISKSFFWFAQELLVRYRNNHKIAYIGGTNYGKTFGEATYFFSRFGCGTYASATWKRVYDLYEYELNSYLDIRATNGFRKNFTSKFAYKNTLRRFDNFIKNGGNTYDLQMVYLVHKYNMLNIVPNVNLCTNIGFDDEATNYSLDKDKNKKYSTIWGNRKRSELDEIIHPKVVNADIQFEKKYYYYRVHYGKSLIRTRYEYYIRPMMRCIFRFLFKKGWHTVLNKFKTHINKSFICLKGRNNF